MLIYVTMYGEVQFQPTYSRVWVFLLFRQKQGTKKTDVISNVLIIYQNKREGILMLL